MTRQEVDLKDNKNGWKQMARAVQCEKLRIVGATTRVLRGQDEFNVARNEDKDIITTNV